mmetsp:Transcript_60848/g.168708  ORF Transcript_60848/g.168708 Transcript_60848/m.168708 type:complete len:204 (+) Transcript_60848:136-747(+)
MWRKAQCSLHSVEWRFPVQLQPPLRRCLPTSSAWRGRPPAAAPASAWPPCPLCSPARASRAPPPAGASLCCCRFSWCRARCGPCCCHPRRGCEGCSRPPRPQLWQPPARTACPAPPWCGASRRGCAPGLHGRTPWQRKAWTACRAPPAALRPPSLQPAARRPRGRPGQPRARPPPAAAGRARPRRWPRARHRAGRAPPPIGVC